MLWLFDNKAGTLDVGDVIHVNASHAFQNDLITVEAQTTLSDGLTLDFAQDGPFTIGDEIRFQARGYTGDFVASGEYTDPAFPTTFEVEVTTTGDVDAGAVIKYTRLDNGETAGGINAASVATFLQDGVNIAFTAGKRLYEGDRFFILDVQVFSRSGVQGITARRLSDGVGSIRPRFRPLMCFVDGFKSKTSLIFCANSLSFWWPSSHTISVLRKSNKA